MKSDNVVSGAGCAFMVFCFTLFIAFWAAVPYLGFQAVGKL